MKTHTMATLGSCRTMLDGRLIDGTLVDGTHAQLLDRIAEWGTMWQEVIEAPMTAVWKAVAEPAAGFYGHLPDVSEVTPLGIGRDADRLVRFTRDLAGRRQARIGGVLAKIPGSMICVSDLDPHEPSATATLPTLYSFEMHEHSSGNAWTTVVLTAVTLGVFNPWLLATLGHQCSSIRRAINGDAAPSALSPRRPAERLPNRLAIAGVASR